VGRPRTTAGPPPHAGPLQADFAPPDEDRAGDDPYLRDSALAQELFDRAAAEAAAGNEERAVVHLLRAAKRAETAREWHLAADAFHRLGEVYLSPAPPCDLERALRMYGRAIAAYEACGEFAAARRLAYAVLRLKLTRGRELGLPWRTRVELFAFWVVAGFGYRPSRVAVAAAAVVVGFAVAYWASGGVIAAGHPAGSFADALYLSGVTFTTVGFGDVVPAAHVRALALAEGAAGLFFTGFFVVVLAKRLRH
jgi:tetratricopeptide (TPR) repeat protein